MFNLLNTGVRVIRFVRNQILIMDSPLNVPCLDLGTFSALYLDTLYLGPQQRFVSVVWKASTSIKNVKIRLKKKVEILNGGERCR